MEEKGLGVNAGNIKIMICGTDLWYGPGLPAEFRRVSMRRLSHEWAATTSFATAASTGCTRNCIGLKRLTKDPDYRCTWCQGTARP